MAEKKKFEVGDEVGDILLGRGKVLALIGAPSKYGGTVLVEFQNRTTEGAVIPKSVNILLKYDSDGCMDLPEGIKRISLYDRETYEMVLHTLADKDDKLPDEDSGLDYDTTGAAAAKDRTGVDTEVNLLNEGPENFAKAMEHARAASQGSDSENTTPEELGVVSRFKNHRYDVNPLTKPHNQDQDLSEIIRYTEDLLKDLFNKVDTPRTIFRLNELLNLLCVYQKACTTDVDKKTDRADVIEDAKIRELFTQQRASELLDACTDTPDNLSAETKVAEFNPADLLSKIDNLIESTIGATTGIEDGSGDMTITIPYQPLNELIRAYLSEVNPAMPVSEQALMLHENDLGSLAASITRSAKQAFPHTEEIVQLLSSRSLPFKVTEVSSVEVDLVSGGEACTIRELVDVAVALRFACDEEISYESGKVAKFKTGDTVAIANYLTPPGYTYPTIILICTASGELIEVTQSELIQIFDKYITR